MTVTIGDVYWYSRPEVGESPSIPHPYVVLQTASEHDETRQVFACGMTTNMKKLSWPGCVVLDVNEANLAKTTIVDGSQTLTVEETKLGAYIGRLSEERVSQIVSGIEAIKALQQRRVRF